MTQINTDSWGDFTAAVSKAHQAGENVEIIVGSDISGVFVAVVDCKPEEETEF